MTQQASRRPRIVIGPGILIAVLIAAIIAFRYMPERQQQHGPPKVEHRLVGRLPMPALTIKELLKESAPLKLSKQQLTQLRHLAAQWERDSQADRQRLARETRTLQSWLQSAQKTGKRIAQTELQRRQAVYSSASNKMVYLRQLYWKMALKVLNSDQRRQAEELALRALTPSKQERKPR